MQLRSQYRYSLLVPTSMGIRMTPVERQPVHMASQYTMWATSAETNAASISAALGLPVKVLTAFVKESPISRFIKNDLAGRHMEYEAYETEQGGPWGYRHQINIADSGYGLRGPRVYNDRAGEVGRILSAPHFNLDRIFAAEGVQIVHLSGLIAALSPETGELCLEIARKAKANSTLVSFDINYRASFWKDRTPELRRLFSEIAANTDILIGNEEDFQLALGIKGPEGHGKNLAGEMDAFKEMIYRVHEAFPNASMFANTLREVISANMHRWGAMLYTGGEWYTEEPREIPVLDRIGGGDGFVGGLLYGVLKGWDARECLRFAWASGALVATLLTDYGLPVDEDEVWNIWAGNARVKR